MNGPMPSLLSFPNPFASTPSDRRRARRAWVIAGFAVAALSSWTACPTVSAGTIYWNMESLGPTLASEPGVAATDLLQGNTSVTGTNGQVASSGYSFAIDGTTQSASGLNNLQFRATSGTLSLATSGYLQLTVSATASGPHSVTGFGFGTRSTATGPQAYSILASTDGFVTNQSVGSGTLLTDSVWKYKTHDFVTPLSLSPDSPITFRLYAYGGTSAANGNWRLDDVQITVVPEPLTGVLVVGFLATQGLAAMWRSCRRRGRKAAPTRPS